MPFKYLSPGHQSLNSLNYELLKTNSNITSHIFPTKSLNFAINQALKNINIAFTTNKLY